MPACLSKIRVLRRLLISSLLVAVCVGIAPLAQATTKHKSHAAAQTGAKKSSAKAKSSGKPASKKSGATKSTAKHGAPKAAQAKSCYETVVKKGKKHKVKVACPPASEPMLSKSPINAKALEQSGQPQDNAPVKARSAPIRAYAVDGVTFFHNGRKFRIEGLDAGSGAELTHEHAAQRLQQILDSGAVTTESLGPDDSGAMRAVVRVDGRNVADLMKQRP